MVTLEYLQDFFKQMLQEFFKQVLQELQVLEEKPLGDPGGFVSTLLKVCSWGFANKGPSRRLRVSFSSESCPVFPPEICPLLPPEISKSSPVLPPEISEITFEIPILNLL